MPTPNFEDAPDGSSSINHTGSAFSEENCSFWEDIDPWADIPSHPPQLREPGIADFAWSDFSAPAGSPVNPALPPPQTATQVNEARRRANPEWRSIPARPLTPEEGEVRPAVPPNPVGYSSHFPPPCSPPRRSPRRTATEQLREALLAPPLLAPPPPPPLRPRSRRVLNNPDAAIRKDPNAWSLREAVELCKLLEVVLPEAGFHIALTGGLLYKEGRRKDCDLMFYQIRQVDPNYEVLWKYLTVAGVIRHPGYTENGWLVKATYRGKLIDCLFPNAKKAKKARATNPGGYNFTPPPPPDPRPTGRANSFEELRAEISAHLAAPYTAAELLATPAPAPVPPPPPPVDAPPPPVDAPILVRHNDGIPEFVMAGTPSVVDYIDRSFAAQRAIREERQAEAAAEAQDDIPF